MPERSKRNLSQFTVSHYKLESPYLIPVKAVKLTAIVVLVLTNIKELTFAMVS